MKIELYNNKSDIKKLNKNLENKQIYDMTFKGTADLINPLIRLRTKTPVQSNYCYIPDFNRYYFIESIHLENNNIAILNLKVDVLMSFKDDILNSKGIVTSDDVGSPYLDTTEPIDVRKDHIIIESDVDLELGKEYVVNILGR